MFKGFVNANMSNLHTQEENLNLFLLVLALIQLTGNDIYLQLTVIDNKDKIPFLPQMPIYHYLEYKCPLMMHEGAFASLKLLIDSFLSIKRINLTVYLIVSSNMIVSQLGSGPLCLTVYTYFMKDSPCKTIG